MENWWQRRARLAWLGMACAAVLWGCGGGGGGDATPAPAPAPAPAPVPTTVIGTVQLVAGSGQRQGAADGIGSQAQFNLPVALVQDASGNAFVADLDNHVIRRVTPDGRVTTFAGRAGESGTVDGVGDAARFDRPNAITIDPFGNLYVVNANGSTIRRISPTGAVDTIGGHALLPPASIDGPPGNNRFNNPIAIAVDAARNVYVAESALVRRIGSDGTVTTFAGNTDQVPQVAGDGRAARFANISALAIDGNGDLLVAETSVESTIGQPPVPVGFLRRFNAAGRALPVLAGRPDLLLSVPFVGALAIDSRGIVLASCCFLPPISRGAPGWTFASVYRLLADGTTQRIAGDDSRLGHTDGAGSVASFQAPRGIAAGPAGLLVADQGNHAIRRIADDGSVTTVAGGTGIGFVDGAATVARFRSPTGLAAGPGNTLLVADTSNRALRRVAADGAVSTIPQVAVDGAPALVAPRIVVSDGSGGLLVVDGMDLQQLDAAGRRRPVQGGIRFLGLIGSVGSDDAGTLYVSNGDGSISERKPDGSQRIFASGFTGELAGAANATEVYVTDGLVLGVYDRQGRQLRFVRLVAAGTDPTRVPKPTAVAIDPSGNFYFADVSNALRIVRPDGVVQSVVDTGGLALGPTGGALQQVRGLAWANGALHATAGNAVVRLRLQP